MLLSGCPREEEVVRVARDLADAILHLHAVRSASRPPLARPSPARHGQEDACGAAPGDAAALLASSFLAKGGRAARRMVEYERKATSRRAELIRRLDYLTIEARRRSTLQGS